MGGVWYSFLLRCTGLSQQGLDHQGKGRGRRSHMWVLSAGAAFGVLGSARLEASSVCRQLSWQRGTVNCGRVLSPVAVLWMH